MRLVPLLVVLSIAVPAVRAQTAPEPGTCTLGQAEATLDVGDVWATVFNTGGLFYGGASANEYFVPAGSGRSPIYAAGLWLGGTVGGELRVAGGSYGAPALNYTFWPGPLGPDARPASPSDCSAYDRIYTVSRADVTAYYATGEATDDLREWPVGLGAPVLDGDGVAGNYDLTGGDQPAIRGDQTAWWLMNDVGNVHPAQDTPPLGVEVRVEAFGFATQPRLAQTTVYRYTVVNKGDAPITDVYASLWTDPELGEASDDYVGSDTTRGMGYVYNADDVDGSGDGTSYGTPPPAAGFDLLLGPVVPDGPDAGADPDVLGLTAVSGHLKFLEPTDGQEQYNYQRGLWRDGSTMRAFGNGFAQTQGEVTTFAFPGDPVTNQFWSERNSDAAGTTQALGDRRLVLSTGPFTLPSGVPQNVVFAIIFAQGTDNLNSVTILRNASDVTQAAFDAGYFEPERVPGFGGPIPASDRVALSLPSPNPFTDRAAVRYEIPSGTAVRAALYDVLGRLVAVVHDGPTADRTGEFVVDGRGLAPGTYLLRVRVPAGERVVTVVRR